MREVMRLVWRDRLVDLLHEATNSPLTIVQAPFGYGKTVAVRQFVARTSQRVVWVDLDESRAQLPRPDLLANPHEKTLVVLDDFQAASDEVTEELSRLVSTVPPHVRLLVTTRRNLHLPVARWRAQGLVADVGLDDLRFREGETLAAFEDGALDEAESAAVRRITLRSEGWAAGIQLFTPTPAPVAPGRRDEYDAAAGAALLDVILADQPPELQEFLLTTSILFTFTADLGRAVTGRPDAGQLIDQARDANLMLLPVDDQHVWFRYQRLFAELLRDRLAERGEDEVRALHRRAATWLLERQEPDAVGHLVAAGEGDDALIRLVSDVESFSRGGRSQGIDWSTVFPTDWVEQSPLRMIYVATVLTRTGWTEQADIWLDAAERAHAESAPPSQAERALLAAARAVLHAVEGNAEQASVLGRQALALMDDPGGTPVGRRLLVMLAMLYLVGDQPDEAEAMCAVLDRPQQPDVVRALLVPALRAGVAERRGQLRLAERLARAALQTVETLELPFHASMSEARIALAGVLRERGDFEEAEDQALAAAEVVETQGWGAVAQYCQIEVAKARIARAGPRAGLAVMDELRADPERPLPQVLATAIAGIEARTRLAMGDLDRAAQLVDELPPSPLTTLLEARVALARHDPDTAQRLIDEVTEVDLRTGLMRSLIAVRIALVRGDNAARDSHLLAAAIVGADEGFCSVFLEVVPDLLPVLRHLAAGRGRLRPLIVGIDRYLAAIVDTRPQSQPLSERERSVLRYLPSQLTNREIAAELDITTNTLKTHLRSLYRKLNVTSRHAAVRQARAMGVLR
jgi:LuxR family maltose regulon positive regulatory protein